MGRRVCCVLTLSLAAGCAARGGAVPEPFPRPDRGLPTVVSTPRSTDTYSLTSTALDFRGTPFVDGGSTPDGFDCSGFTYYVFRQHGVELPRRAADQYEVGDVVDPAEIEPGDLLFFTTVAPGASHVALALGGDEFVHAPSERGQVRVERLSSIYWSRRFLGARRVRQPSPAVTPRPRS
jgi:cell wall-associated NlpC family hydrolase